MIFNKFKAFSTFSSYGDVSIICKSNLGHPPFTMVLHNCCFFSPKNVKLLIIFPMTSSSSMTFLKRDVNVEVSFSGIFSFVSDNILASSDKINSEFFEK